MYQFTCSRAHTHTHIRNIGDGECEALLRTRFAGASLPPLLLRANAAMQQLCFTVHRTSANPHVCRTSHPRHRIYLEHFSFFGSTGSNVPDHFTHTLLFSALRFRCLRRRYVSIMGVLVSVNVIGMRTDSTHSMLDRKKANENKIKLFIYHSRIV